MRRKALLGGRTTIWSTGRDVAGIRAFATTSTRAQLLANVDLRCGAIDARLLSIIGGVSVDIVVMLRVVIMHIASVIASLRLVIAGAQTHKHQG